MKSVLPYFTPTEVVLIDDDVMSLKRIKRTLSPTHCRVQDFDHPMRALEYLKQSLQDNDTLIALTSENLHQALYSPDRFKQISTIVIDYDMPGMNGLEVCKHIISPYIQKIMLTGAATTDIAVEAFNEGIIHHFIKKDDPNVFTKLKTSIIKGQERYFNLKTHVFVTGLHAEYPEAEILKDPAFVDFFEKLIQEKQVVEYYLLDTMGSFLLLSETGNPSSLFVFDEEALEFQEDMIPENDRNTDLAHEVYTKKQAICFYPFKTLEKYDPQNWKNYIQPLKRLETKSPLFYAFVSDITNLDQSKVVSFKDYLLKAEQ